VTGYEGKHRKPDELPAAMRGVADLIVIVPSKSEEQ
jgi:hypothetical protein